MKNLFYKGVYIYTHRGSCFPSVGYQLCGDATMEPLAT
jgi:hypothetical protein